MNPTERNSRGDACPWDSGKLGEDEAHVVVSSAEEERAVEDALGLQMISIRLQKTLLRDLKTIADHHGIGYQPMIRDLLNRFARSELEQILEARLKELKASQENSVTQPVEDFLERERNVG
ncbi:hypothetical protein QLQ15_13220 [Lysobacter sp. LF1]|uniref:Ribbon-helix-helix protein, CopG family n=1 Tax=Lysobacter stagni TaxID=3045172 RepID=A0ABT6XII6_9GAMM|nr:hypothetical protein [Lysobacter sp. LF1]MDI9239866.1 hypothetical protein [Lysobacter sp. LF1]